MNNGMTATEREDLLKRVAKAETKAQECQIEAAVYREQLIECERLAHLAIETENPQLLHGALSTASLTLQAKNVKEWAKDWRNCWKMDIKWLERSLQTLKEIKTVAGQLSVDETQQRLKAKILERATGALIQHAPSSVSVD
jgi:hypothetical protein